MIGFLEGKLLAKEATSVLLNVQGVGYEVQIPGSTFVSMPSLGDSLRLHTHMLVKEETQQLYGFIDPQQKDLFRHLIRVSSVGPKLALAILSGISPQSFVHAIIQEDLATLTQISGIGKKTAERLVLELRDKMSDMPFRFTTPDSSPEIQTSQAENDAIRALLALGYKSKDARNAILIGSGGELSPTMSTEELVRRALQHLSRASG